jgi:hypothetical protein
MIDLDDDDNPNDKIRRMMGRAFDQAFQAQIAHLFQIFITNQGSVASQKEYTKKGIENAINAYRLAQSAMADWEG